MMLAVQRRMSSAEKEDDDIFWNGLRVLEESYTPSCHSIGNLRRLNNENTTKNVPIPRDQEFPPAKLDDVLGVTSQNEQHMHRQVLQEPATSPKYPSQKITPSHFKPSGNMQNGWQDASCGRRRTSSCPARTESLKKLAHTSSKAEEQQQEGPKTVETQAEQLANPKQMHMHSDSLNGSAVLSLATGSLRSLRRRKPQPWPNPKDSLGDMIYTNNKKIKGKVWIAEGPALRLFETQVRPEIEKLLHGSEPPQCAPLLLTLYMIGKKETSTNPIIMICCCDRKARKDAEALIRESDILQQFPQMGLGNSASPLEADAFVVPAAGSSTSNQRDTQILSNFEISGFKKPVIGRRLRFVKIADGKETVRFATGGPFIRIEKHTYQLTATHINQNMGAGLEMQFDSDDDCEYDGQSDTDTDEEEGAEEVDDVRDGLETGTQGNSQESCNALLEFGVRSHIRDSDEAASPERLYRQDLWNAQDTTGVDQTMLGPSRVDYYLVKLPAEEAKKASNVLEKFGSYSALQVTDISGLPNPGTKVIVATSYNHLIGIVLPGKTRVKMHGFYGFQNLLAVRLSSSIKPGDSGSAVLDASTGCLYGHITLGSAPGTIAYMVPSIDTLTQIVAAFGKLPTLNVEPSTLAIEIPQGNAQNTQDDLSMCSSSSDLCEDSQELTVPLDPSETVESNIPQTRSRIIDQADILSSHETENGSHSTADEVVPVALSESIPIWIARCQRFGGDKMLEHV